MVEVVEIVEVVKIVETVEVVNSAQSSQEFGYESIRAVVNSLLTGLALK